MEDLQRFRKLPDQIVFRLTLGLNYPRNKKNTLQNGQWYMPNCRQIAETIGICEAQADHEDYLKVTADGRMKLDEVQTADKD